MLYKSHRTGPGRVFDHLYDPLYITPGKKDVLKENHNALFRSAPIRIYPHYRTMFSDLPGRPRNYYIQQRNPLPQSPFIDEADRNGNNEPERNGKMRKIAVVGGRDRAKFFNIPLNNEVTMNLQLDIKKDHVCCDPQSSTRTEGFKSVACETMYRDQSAQTKCWMPDSFISDKCEEIPELVYAAKCITSNAIPGVLEVKQLERSQRRRELEKTFAQGQFAKDKAVRQVFLEALEWEDRVGREEELEYCQQLRLEMVKKMVDSRENKMRNNFTRQMEKTIHRLQVEKEKKLNKLRVNHQRTIRRLEKQSGAKSRRSKYLVKEQQQTSFVSYNTDFEARLDGLHKMPTMPTNLERFTKPKALISKPKEPIKEVRKGLWTEKFLTHLYTSLKFIQQKNLHQRTAKCLRNIREEVMSYVSTARPSIESDENGSEYQHAVFLQKIIKGRAVQSLLHDGKDANQELIDQMKETFKLESVWKAECCDDWNESSLMDFLGSYLEQEFARYAQQKSLSYKQKLSEQQENIERKEVVRTKEENIASDCLDDVFTDMFQNISESGKFEQIEDGSSNDETSENVIKVPDETKGQQNDQKMVSGKEQIINEIIEHVLQKVIPQTAEGMTNDIINDIIMKTMEMVASVPELDSCGMDKEIGSMLDDLCNQILNSMDMTDSDECSESQIDSLDE